jgi:hypothetical protein
MRRAWSITSVSDTRDDAAENAVQAWAELASEHDGIRQVALIADASNQEIDRLNARAQHLRAGRGELGPRDRTARRPLRTARTLTSSCASRARRPTLLPRHARHGQSSDSRRSGEPIASRTASRYGSSSPWPLCGLRTCRSQVSSNSTTRTPPGVLVSARIVRSLMGDEATHGLGPRMGGACEGCRALKPPSRGRSAQALSSSGADQSIAPLDPAM